MSFTSRHKHSLYYTRKMFEDTLSVIVSEKLTVQVLKKTDREIYQTVKVRRAPNTY